eukprot:6174863-Pleurochrysis_carterae.AAC.1
MNCTNGSSARRDRGGTGYPQVHTQVGLDRVRKSLYNVFKVPSERQHGLSRQLVTIRVSPDAVRVG